MKTKERVTVSFLRNSVEKVVGKLKKNPEYKLEIPYSNKELFFIMKYRGGQVFRGLFKRMKFKSCKGIFFCGRNVVVEHGYLLRIGKSLILEDKVHINALSEKGIILGENVTIAKDAILVCTGVIKKKGVGITIGNRSAVGAQSFLGGQGGIEIGDDVIMGPGVRMFSENHNYDKPDILIREQGENRKGIKIYNNCWIGAGATILDGVIIGEGSVVAAGSVVTKSIPENSIVAGVPGKVLKKRIEKK